ncbi:histidine phosphatase family protein [Hymenobacter psoromatis]|uniref:histidine phosphatase family protein n=1 Tax=Hymenobacter psoromatis TaxID=1484116 RepID=UPI001CBF7AA1|nr:histidine phosphatase family protein [Hymenobacter psoromatis]
MPKFTATDKARLYLLYLLSPLAPPKLPTLRVIIIRHGEKPEEGDNLSCAGLNRALALPAVLNQLMPTPPDYTYVPLIGTDDQNTSTARMFQTVTPYAVQRNLVINSDYDVDNTKGIAKELRYQRGTALLVWEHESIPEIAKELGIKGPLEWSDADFDSIWIIDFSGGGAKGKAKRPVLIRSREAIYPSVTCPS